MHSGQRREGMGFSRGERPNRLGSTSVSLSLLFPSSVHKTLPSRGAGEKISKSREERKEDDPAEGTVSEEAQERKGEGEPRANRGPQESSPFFFLPSPPSVSVCDPILPWMFEAVPTAAGSAVIMAMWSMFISHDD